MKTLLAGLFVLICLLTLTFVLVKRPVLSSAPQNDSLSAEKLTALVNEWRVESGFKPYERNEALCRIANDRIKDAADNHSGFIKKYFNYSSVVSENMTIASTNESALASWLASPPHRKALEHDYKYSCISTSQVNATQIFSNCENGCM